MDAFSGSGKRTVGDSIVEILAEEFPLTVNELRVRIKKRYNLSVSYQAVHKELGKMLDSHVLQKDQGAYLLNIRWVLDKANFYRRTEQNYTKQQKHSIGLLKKIREDGVVVNLEFATLNEIDEYFLSVMEYFESLVGEAPVIMHYRHNTWPVLHAQKEAEILKKDEHNAKFYCLCGSDTPLDKWACTYERSIGMHVKHKENATNWTLHVYGDIIIQINTDPDIVRQVDAFFNSSSVLDYNPKHLIDIQNKKARHTVLMYRNQLLAEQIRTETISQFQ